MTVIESRRMAAFPCSVIKNPHASIFPGVDSTIYWINHYPLDSSTGFNSTDQMDIHWIALSSLWTTGARSVVLLNCALLE